MLLTQSYGVGKVKKSDVSQSSGEAQTTDTVDLNRFISLMMLNKSMPLALCEHRKQRSYLFGIQFHRFIDLNYLGTRSKRFTHLV